MQLLIIEHLWRKKKEGVRREDGQQRRSKSTNKLAVSETRSLAAHVPAQTHRKLSNSLRVDVEKSTQQYKAPAVQKEVFLWDLHRTGKTARSLPFRHLSLFTSNTQEGCCFPFLFLFYVISVQKSNRNNKSGCSKQHREQPHLCVNKGTSSATTLPTRKVNCLKRKKKNNQKKKQNFIMSRAEQNPHS